MEVMLTYPIARASRYIPSPLSLWQLLCNIHAFLKLPQFPLCDSLLSCILDILDLIIVMPAFSFVQQTCIHSCASYNICMNAEVASVTSSVHTTQGIHTFVQLSLMHATILICATMQMGLQAAD